MEARKDHQGLTASLDDSGRTQILRTSDLHKAMERSEPVLPAVWVDMQAPGSALLELRRGPGWEPGTQFILKADVTELGRHPECGIVLDHATVSRRHAEIRREGSTFTLRDLGSLNGTYLNRGAIDSAELGDGDEIWIGTFRLVFRAASEYSDRVRHGEPVVQSSHGLLGEVDRSGIGA